MIKNIGILDFMRGNVHGMLSFFRRRAGQGGEDSGNGVVGYLAVIVLIATVSSALMVAQLDTRMATSFKEAICRIVSYLDPTTCVNSEPVQAKAPEKPPVDIWPQWCVSSRDKIIVGAKARVGIFKIGADIQYMREDSAEEGLATDPGLDENGLGHFVYLSFVPDGDSVGATAEWGGDLSLGGVDLGREATLGGGINYHAGDVYRLPAADADKLIKNIQKWEAYQTALKLAKKADPTFGLFTHLVTKIPGVGMDKPKIPDPIITYQNVDAYLDGNLKFEQVPPMTLDKSAKYTTGAGVEVNVNIGGEQEVEHRYLWTNPDGSTDPVTGVWTSLTGEISGTGNLGADVGPVGGGVSVKGGFKVMETMRVFRYDKAGIHNGVPHKAGDLRDVRFKLITFDKNGYSTKGSDGSDKGKKSLLVGNENMGQTTRNLEIDTNSPESRAAVEDWLSNSWVHLKFPDIIYDELTGGGVKDPGPDASAFDKLAYDTGMGWRETADANTTTITPKFDISDGVGLGVEGDYSHLTLDTNKAEILDHPSNGERSFIDFPMCTAAGNK